ncbi:MAG: T9SS type A sorting domain-containing protein [bacterium]
MRNVSEKRLPNGVYFYRLTAGDYTNTKKMVVVR